MNPIDLIVCIVLCLALWNGWRQGAIVQLCSLAGFFAAVWIAARFGAAAGARCGFDPEIAAPAGFVLVLLAALCAVALLARFARKVFRFAGLGALDVLLGMAISVVKYVLLLSLLCTAFDRMNADGAFVAPERTASSKAYRPLLETADRLFPFVDQLREEAAGTLSKFRAAETE